MARLTLVLGAVKLQIQVQKDTADRLYKGPLDCARQIVKSHGALGLWTGFTGSLAFRTNFLWMFGSFEVSYPTSGQYNASKTMGVTGTHAWILQT